MPADKPVDYQQLCKQLLQAVPLPMCIIDRTLSIYGINQAALDLCAIPLHIQDMKLGQVIANINILNLVQQCIHTNQPRHGLYDRGSLENAWKVSVTPLLEQSDAPQEHETVAFYAVIIEDMAEPHRLERGQRDFLANISHELRTPLTSVRLLAETLEDIIETDPERSQQFVEKIENEVAYLSEMVSELLELSRIEAGQLQMIIEPVEAAQLIHEVRARMLPLAQRHRVRLRADIQKSTTYVAADSKLITRALVNLVHNAIKFTPSSGTITIGTASQLDQQMQRFFVHDTGIGISPQELPRIFERFYKTNHARSKSDFIGPGRGGTGLGLAIARQVVEAHGGHMIAESTSGQGSTFIFLLPIVKKQ